MSTQDLSAAAACKLAYAQDSFKPPEDFDHGVEFFTELPPKVTQGRYAQGRLAEVYIPMIFGGACIATHSVPFVRTLSLYVLPLEYLNWIGVALILLGLAFWTRNQISLGLMNYIRRGEPLIGRVCNTRVKVDKYAQRFVAEVEFRNPESGEMRTAIMESEDTFSYWDAPMMDPGVLPGQYVTLVYFPHRPKQLPRLFGWLGLHPDHDFLRKCGRPLEPVTPIIVLKNVLFWTACVWAVFGMFYVIGRYRPLDFRPWLHYLIAAGIATPAFVALGIYRARRYMERAKMYSEESYLGGVLLGLCGGFLFCFISVDFLNGWLDRRPAHQEPIRIVQLHSTTQNGVLRDYQLEFQYYPAGPTLKRMVSFRTLSRFEPNSFGVIDVGDGWLNVPWLRDFHPIEWVIVKKEAEVVFPGEITFRKPNDLEPIRIAPVVWMGEQSCQPPPEALLSDLRAKKIADLANTLKATVIDANKP